MKKYKTLYKLNTNGSTQVWSIYHDDESYFTVASKLGGKEIQNTPTIVKAKGKNTQAEQVISEVDSKIRKKIDKKYVENIEDINKAEGDLDGYTAMLAHKFKEQKHKINFPCAMQRKYDGIRCLATKDGFFSRGRKQFSSCQHIWKELAPFFAKYPNARLDGEFYTHEYKDEFELICSAVKKTADKAIDKDIKLQNKVEYHVYDAPRLNGLNETDTFIKRQKMIAEELKNLKSVKVAETLYGVKEEDINEQKGKWIEEGYEGAMIRNTNMPYEYKRSYNLLKLKDFDDSEFEIIGIKEGTGNYSGHVGSFTVKMKNGKEFDAKLMGSMDRLRYLFTHQKEAIGKMATVRHQGFSTYGIPRFPVMREIRGLKNRSDWV